jgi:hypothetical protein
MMHTTQVGATRATTPPHPSRSWLPRMSPGAGLHAASGGGGALRPSGHAARLHLLPHPRGRAPSSTRSSQRGGSPPSHSPPRPLPICTSSAAIPPICSGCSTARQGLHRLERARRRVCRRRAGCARLCRARVRSPHECSKNVNSEP